MQHLGSYDTIGEFNVDSKAECDQLNLAHETKTNKKPNLAWIADGTASQQIYSGPI